MEETVHKDLGFHFDFHFQWASHVSNVFSRIDQRLCFLHAMDKNVG